MCRITALTFLWNLRKLFLFFFLQWGRLNNRARERSGIKTNMSMLHSMNPERLWYKKVASFNLVSRSCWQQIVALLGSVHISQSLADAFRVQSLKNTIIHTAKNEVVFSSSLVDFLSSTKKSKDIYPERLKQVKYKDFGTTWPWSKVFCILRFSASHALEGRFSSSRLD